MKLADRILAIEGSKSVGLSAIVEKLKSEGQDIIALNVGEPDFQTPKEIINATKQALLENKTRYSLVQGLVELRKALAKKLILESNLNVSENNILLGNGSKHILYNIFQSLLNPGDEVIIPLPFWVTFPESIKLAGGTPVSVESKDNFQLDFKKIESSINDKTKAILVNSPNNPTGVVYPKEDLLKLVELATKYDLTIIADDAYELLTYDAIKYIPIASLSEEAFNRTITVQSFSKSYCMTGFRIGYLVAPESFVNGVNKLQGHLTGNNCTFAQYGAIAALEMDKSILHNMVRALEKRRDLAFELFSKLFDCQKPQGAFYLFPSIKPYIDSGRFKDSEDLARYILKKAHVAVLPGSAFGMENYIRISFAPDDDKIIEAYERIRKVL